MKLNITLTENKNEAAAFIGEENRDIAIDFLDVMTWQVKATERLNPDFDSLKYNHWLLKVTESQYIRIQDGS